MMKKYFSLSLALFLVAVLSFNALAEEAAKGVWNDDIYENEIAGISFALPEGWRSVPQETLKTSAETGLIEALIVLEPESRNVVFLSLFAQAEEAATEEDGTAEEIVEEVEEAEVEEVAQEEAVIEEEEEKDPIEKSISAYIDSEGAELGETSEVTLQGNSWNVTTLTLPETGGLRYILSRASGDYLVSLAFYAENGDALDSFLALFP